MCVFQLRGWVEEENRTIEFSIGKTSTEGKAHMMCIEGSDGKLLAPSLPDLCLFLTQTHVNTCVWMIGRIMDSQSQMVLMSIPYAHPTCRHP